MEYNKNREVKMKKLLMMLLSICLMIGFIWADKIEAKKSTIIRSAVMAKDNVGIAKPGDQFEVLAVFGSWHFIEIIANSKHVGKQGWIWRKLIDGKKVIGDGAVLHTEPLTASPEVCRVKVNAQYKLIKKNVKWYQIGKNRFVYYYNFKNI